MEESANSVLSYFYLALNDLYKLVWTFDDDTRAEVHIKLLMGKLRCLRTFIICSRRFGNETHLNNDADTTLGSLLVRIEDVVCRNHRAIKDYCDFLLLEGDDDPTFSGKKVGKFRRDVESFEEEMKQWYTSFPYYYSQLSSSPVMPIQVIHIADSILESVEDFLFLPVDVTHFPPPPVEAFKENITFLRNFFRFATLPGADEPRGLQELFTYVEPLAINAAHITECLFSSRNYYLKPSPIQASNIDGMILSISAWMEKIKHFDSQVYATHTRVLASLKHLIRELPVPALNIFDDDPTFNIMENFLVSLLYCLSEMLERDTVPVVSMKNQLQALYEALRSLRLILKEQPNMFVDVKIRDLGVVICDVGVVIFSLYHKEDTVIDVGVSDLLEKIGVIHTKVEEHVLETSEFNFPEVIRTKVEDQVPETSEFSFPKTNVLGFLDFLLDNLMEVKSCKVDLGAQMCIQKIGEHLLFLRSFLGVLVVLQNQQEDLQALHDLAVELAFKMEFLIDQLVLKDIQESFSSSTTTITEQIEMIKADAMKIFHCSRQPIQLRRPTATLSMVPSESSTIAADEVVGLEAETTSIIDRLTRGSKKLQVVAIVGMPGLGKTTIAQKVYNHPSVRHHFNVHASCTISQVFETKVVVLKLLTQTLGNLPNGYLEMEEGDLIQELWRSLKRRRYLIFVDDVWDRQAFDRLIGSFPDDSTESRILLTSRNHDVAPEAILDEKPHHLRQFTGKESLELLRRKLFPGKDWPASLYELGMQIAECCKGLPLTTVIVAGILSNTKPEVWNETLESISADTISGTEVCNNAIELSYQHLPDHLKPCLLSFGSFPEDHEVSVKRLIWYWVAEGFVRKDKSKSLEKVAKDYLKNLIGRSLVMETQKSSRGDVKTCCTHDLLRDFYLRKAKEENLFQDLLSVNKKPSNLPRLDIESCNYLSTTGSILISPHFRSLVSFGQLIFWSNISVDISSNFRMFQRLKVLNMEQVWTGSKFPKELGLLVQLRYLAMETHYDVSPSIGNLSNLQTFIITSNFAVQLPKTLWNLQKLRHLCSGHPEKDLKLPIDNLDSSSTMNDLDSLSNLLCTDWDVMEKQLRKFPNIRHLKCKLHKEEGNGGMITSMAFAFLSLLESLTVSIQPLPRDSFVFIFPKNLKKLSLEGCKLLWTQMNPIAELPHLEVLKLLHDSFIGKTWDVEEAQFPKLRFLKLQRLMIINWTASDEEFPNLQKLVLKDCGWLKQIPVDCLQNAPSLGEIEVSGSSRRLEGFVDEIRETQIDMGNSVFKATVLNLRDDDDDDEEEEYGAIEYASSDFDFATDLERDEDIEAHFSSVSFCEPEI
ncbi:OLC1v1032770C1 [Oldenlandia corymbosa var. corymbosa]|uniref:OLC1v1032770C1 n=1 Tax=Oldenlandia corymbosa var. corymbosa TaxID=529605 RepID=A0AAV1CMI8_OLDCO|nr:OLC1v1032770C1 [Oldenlandia corymbosa var. corymbosa]